MEAASEGSEARGSGRSSTSGVLKTFLLCSLTSVLIVYLWTINKQKLADFFDYSVYTYSGAFLKLGLKPYVDFQTPIQTLPFRLSWLAESVWGEHLSSLANANLLLSLAMFLSTYALLKRMTASFAAVSIALSLTVCTALQHGILWHNPLGLWLLVITALISADMIRRRHVPVFHLIAAFSLIAVCAMTKLNYCLAAATVFGFALVVVSLRAAERRTQYLFAAILLPAAACATGVAVDILSTGVSPAAWFHQCVVVPSSRGGTLKTFVTRSFWFGTVNPYYIFNAFRGMFAIATAFYLYAGWQRSRLTSEHVLAAAALGLLWIFGALIAVSNADLASMGAALLPVGLVAVGWAFAPAVNSRRFVRSGVSLAVIYLLMGCVTLFRHSRLLYGPVRGGPYTFINGPAYTGYLSGVKLTTGAATKLNTAIGLVRQHATSAQRVVWGPGLELIARQYGTAPIAGLPLWYHLETTLQDSDAQRIIAAWNAAGVTTVVADEFWAPQMPKQLRDYLGVPFTKQDRERSSSTTELRHRG